MSRKDVAKRALASLQDFKGSPPAADGSRAVPRTYIGEVGAELTRSLEGRLKELQARLAGSETVLSVDPKRVRSTKYANRDARSLAASDPEFAELLESIRSLRANEQPILLRPVESGAEFDYEICFGHRRHAACLALDIPVRALVKTLSDLDLVKAMHRENTQRKDLSAYERALQFKVTLDSNLVSDQNSLAAAFETTQGSVSKHFALLDLPQEVLAAFRDPRVIMLHWVAELNQALKTRREEVLAAARQLAAKEPAELDPLKVKAFLLARAARPKPVEMVGRYEQTMRLSDNKTVGARLKCDGRALRVALGRTIASPELMRKVTEDFEAALKIRLKEAEHPSGGAGKSHA